MCFWPSKKAVSSIDVIAASFTPGSTMVSIKMSFNLGKCTNPYSSTSDEETLSEQTSDRRRIIIRSRHYYYFKTIKKDTNGKSTTIASQTYLNMNSSLFEKSVSSIIKYDKEEQTNPK